MNEKVVYKTHVLHPIQFDIGQNNRSAAHHRTASHTHSVTNNDGKKVLLYIRHFISIPFELSTRFNVSLSVRYFNYILRFRIRVIVSGESTTAPATATASGVDERLYFFLWVSIVGADAMHAQYSCVVSACVCVCVHCIYSVWM